MRLVRPRDNDSFRDVLLAVSPWAQPEQASDSKQSGTASDKLSEVTRIVLSPEFSREPSPFWEPAFEYLCSAGHQVLRTASDFVSAKHSYQTYPGRVRLLAKTVASPAFQDIRKTSQVLMRRENPVGLLRDVDIESFIVIDLGRWIQYLSENETELVIFPVTPHFYDTFLLQKAAEALKIRCLWFQPSAMAPVMLPRDNSGPVFLTEESQPLDSGLNNPIEISLASSLERYSRLKIPSYMVRQVEADDRAKTVLGRLRAGRATMKWLVSDRFPQQMIKRVDLGIPTLLLRLLQILVPRQLSQRLRKSAEFHRMSDDLPEAFILFALHYEPERTSVPEGGGERSQLEQIAKIKGVFPKEVPLVVREHGSQLSSSLQGFMGRSPHFYAAAISMEGIFFDYESDVSDLLEHASWVVTGTGNIGIEAALRGIPVIYFGDPWWVGMPGSTSFTEIIRNPTSIEKPAPFEQKDVKRFLKHRITSEMLPGGASESFEQLSARFPNITREFQSKSSQVLGSFLVREANQVRTTE